MSPGTIMSPKGIHRMLGDTTSSLLKEPIASTSQQRTGSIWLSVLRRKRAKEGPNLYLQSIRPSVGMGCGVRTQGQSSSAHFL